MFSSKVYSSRRNILIDKIRSNNSTSENGIAIFIGNAEAPAQCKDNCYKFRQDSTWLYYFGIDEPNYTAIIDFDNGESSIYANDFEIGDIIWMGPQESVKEKALSVGVEKTYPLKEFDNAVKKALSDGRKIHFIPPTRYYNTLKLRDLSLNENNYSEELIRAIISMRLVKENEEIEQLDLAADLGYEMHSLARNSISLGILEQEIVGKMEGLSLSKGWGLSFPTILTQHGETLHNHIHDKYITEGNLLLIDAGVENNMHYASDFTRTYPTNGKFSTKQKEIYQIFLNCNELAFSLCRPGISYKEIHLAVAKKSLEGLSQIGIVKGDLDTMVAEGINGLFMPHGLGHNMGLDVHDMEDLGETRVGYDDNQQRSTQLGLGNLRMARMLKTGYVITDEPGIYFIPALIEKWKKEKLDKGFVNYSKLEEYYDFGGIRLEDDILITNDGARRLGTKRLPIEIADIESLMAK